MDSALNFDASVMVNRNKTQQNQHKSGVNFPHLEFYTYEVISQIKGFILKQKVFRLRVLCLSSRYEIRNETQYFNPFR